MLKKHFLSILFVLFTLSIPSVGFTAISLPWSTTFNCPEWTYSDGTLHCDGLDSHGAWTCSPTGNEAQVTSAANMPGGGGGRGQRFWLNDGSQNSSGGLGFTFDTYPVPELWFRWYERYESGFQWTGNPLSLKQLFLDGPNSFFFGYHSDDIAFRVYSDPRNTIYSTGTFAAGTGNGWNRTMGGPASDGQWHYYEIHVVTDTDGTDGIAQAWVDGVLRYDVRNINFGTDGGWWWGYMPDNQKHPNNGVCMTVDIDDVAISTTGYIGPIGTVIDTIAPGPPTGIQ